MALVSHLFGTAPAFAPCRLSFDIVDAYSADAALVLERILASKVRTAKQHLTRELSALKLAKTAPQAGDAPRGKEPAARPPRKPPAKAAPGTRSRPGAGGTKRRQGTPSAGGPMALAAPEAPPHGNRRCGAEIAI